MYTLHPLQNSITRNRNLRRTIFRSPCRGGRNTSNNRVYSDTRAVRARDSISGRQGSLTPACGTAWPRRLYYDVYGLIRDILEMSRVHARRVTRRREMRRERLRVAERRGVQGPGTAAEEARRVQRSTCRRTRRVSHRRYVHHPLPLSSSLSPRPSSVPLFLPASNDNTGLSFAVLSTGSVLLAHSFPLF